MKWLGISFGFSYVGAVMLALLLIPNALWARNQPQGYDPGGENRFLLALERVGEALVTCLLLINTDLNLRPWSAWSWWLVAAGLLMALYDGFWLRYFLGGYTLEDFYGPFCGVPVAGATLPVLAVLCLGFYGKYLWLILAAVSLGIGHIGIHLQHKREVDLEKKIKENNP